MCIIIDACCAADLSNRDYPQAKLILDWIRSGGKVVSGGKLEEELSRTGLRRLMVQWSAAGRLIRIKKSEIESEVARLNLQKVRSNDTHVIGLSRCSGAKVVVTRDNDLIYDLKKSGEAGVGRKVFPFPPEPSKNLRIQRGVLRNAQCKA